jgi:hypothetical protein
MRTVSGEGDGLAVVAWCAARLRPALEGVRAMAALPLSHLFARAAGVSWAVVMAWVVTVASVDRHPEFTSRLGCGTDPQDILHPGELLDGGSLRFLVGAHCSNPRYFANGHITLRYGGADFDVETTPLIIGGQTYLKVLSVGGRTEP